MEAEGRNGNAGWLLATDCEELADSPRSRAEDEKRWVFSFSFWSSLRGKVEEACRFGRGDSFLRLMEGCRGREKLSTMVSGVLRPSEDCDL